MEDGDDICADKGCMVHHLLAALGVGITVPPKRYSKQTQLTQLQAEMTEKVANLRIHVERAMRRIKRFRFLQNVIQVHQYDLITDIFFICAGIGNFLPPLKGDDFYDDFNLN